MQLSKPAKTIITFLLLAGAALATTCDITTTGAIQSDGSVSGSPKTGDVYQIQGTITANYVNDDSVSPSTIVVTAPDGVHTVTSGLFLLNAHTNGTNTYAANIAAGFESKGVWVPGTWTWSLNFSDLLSNTCTATGSFTVSSTLNAGGGFIRSYSGTTNLYTDANNTAFWGTGSQGYLAWTDGSPSYSAQYGYGEVPASAMITVNGTAVTWSSGAQFTTQTLPKGVYNQIYICPTGPNSCIYYGGSGLTINSATSMTLPSSGGTYSSPVQAYLGFVRDSTGNHANGYQASLAATAQFYAKWGNNLDRVFEGSTFTLTGTWLETGYNNYNWTTTGNNQAAWGIAAADLWLAAAHAAGIHIQFLALSNVDVNPCPSFSCTGNDALNLQHYWAMIAARYGAFADVWELMNEINPVPQTWVDYVGTVLNTGVTGIAGGNPADPYGHLFTISDWPPYYSSPYGPGTGTPDANLTAIDMGHDDSLNGIPIYSFVSGGFGSATFYCGNQSPLLPSFQGEGPAGGTGQVLGIAPASQTAAAPNDNTNGERIVDEFYVLCGKASMAFANPEDYFAINSKKALNSQTWLDFTLGKLNLQNFMKGMDVAAAPLSVTLGGGCASSACSVEALGSSSHVRLALVSATGNAITGVPNSVTAGTVTLTVPAASMVGEWVAPATGAAIRTFTTSSRAGRQTFKAPNFAVDVWLQLDDPTASAPLKQLSSAAAGVAALAPGSLASAYGTDLASGQPNAPALPWPISYEGTTVTVMDSTGSPTTAPLIYVSPEQVNFQVPSTAALGSAAVTVTSGDGTQSSGQATLTSLAPALFTLNSSNLAAAYAECISSTGTETTEDPFQVVNGAIVAQPLNLSACAKTVLELYATGLDKATAANIQATIGNTTATVQSAGPGGMWPGLDQVDVVIPLSLAGAGSVPVVITAGGVSSNTVNVRIQ
jgi:uncharacterized protein (TIGR03437 family)